MINFTNMHVAGWLPMFLSETDERDAVTQLDANYQHGGGWNDFKGHELITHADTGRYGLQYPGDPETREVSRATLRDETIVLFEHAWVAVIQPDGTFRVARMD